MAELSDTAAASEEVGAIVSRSVDDAEDLNPVGEREIENEVIADRQEAQSQREIVPLLPHERCAGKKAKTVLHFGEPLIGCPRIVFRDEQPNLFQVALRGRRDAIPAHCPEAVAWLANR